MSDLFSYDDAEPTALLIHDPDLWIILTVFAKMDPARLNEIAVALGRIEKIVQATGKKPRLIARFDDLKCVCAAALFERRDNGNE